MSDRISEEIPEGLQSENKIFTDGLIEEHPEAAEKAGIR